MKIDWVPIDVLAEILVELAFKDGRGSTSVYHPSNPHPTTWDTLLPAVIESSLQPLKARRLRLCHLPAGFSGSERRPKPLRPPQTRLSWKFY
jgi:hypothetical protein